MEKIKCDSCCKEFDLSVTQLKEIQEAANSGIERFIIYCPECHSLVFVYPLVLFNLKTEKPAEFEETRLFCCPTTACIGFVEKDNEAKVYGCSECGKEWKNLKDIYIDIEKIITKYEYRKLVYKKKK